MIPTAQRPVADLLGRFAGGSAPIETHISAVFVGPDTVFKLKKAVDLGFLDFSAPAARERFARRELEVNRSFAPGLYRDVVPVTRAPGGGLELDGDGEPVDWVLRMAPVPPADFLDAVAARGGGLTPELLDEAADAVAAMHAALPAAAAGADPVASMTAALDGTRRAALAARLPSDRVGAWATAAAAALGGRAPLLAARAAAGRVRRCHGDLHLKNLCLWRGRVTPFDALEFDEALATIDTGYDLAFLLMDLWHRLGRAAANRALNRYVARTGDAGLVGALPFWLSHRAAIRAHAEGGAAGLDYLSLAEAALRPAAPCLVAVGGLPGTGKSRLARALAPELGATPGALVLRSDEIRKRRHGVPPEERLPASAYAPAENAAVFAELAALAGEALRGGRAVVADAAFLRPEERAAIEAAAPAGVPFRGFWLRAPSDVLRARVAARAGDASDATVAVLEAAAARDPGAVSWQGLDASTDPVPTARALLRAPPVVPW